MSGTASVPNTFQNAVTATGLQLDNNFTTVVAYINDPTNRNNYAADGAATNTVVLTFAPPVVGGYTAGLELTWKWGVTNTSGVVLNANGLGNINLVNPDGSTLNNGQGRAGSIGKAVYDGTRAIYLTPPHPTSKAEMQTATAQASFVFPGAMKWSPGVAKSWGFITATYGIAAGNNVASVSAGGTGTVTVIFTSAMADTAYAVIGTGAQGGDLMMTTQGKTTTSFVAILRDGSAAAKDNDFHFTVFGTLA